MLGNENWLGLMEAKRGIGVLVRSYAIRMRGGGVCVGGVCLVLCFFFVFFCFCFFGGSFGVLVFCDEFWGEFDLWVEC